MADRGMAGVLWASHGWVSHDPHDPDLDHLSSRVWSADPGGRKIFVREWAESCPDNLAFIVVAACGSGGVREDFHELCEAHCDRPQQQAPKQLIGFDTALRGRADYLFTHVGIYTGATYLERYSHKKMLDALYDRTRLTLGQ